MKLVNNLSKEELITEVNKAFKIKVNGRSFVGNSKSLMVGYSGLVEALEDGEIYQGQGEELAEKMCRSALESPDDVYTKKLRRGLTIRFYSH